MMHKRYRVNDWTRTVPSHERASSDQTEKSIFLRYSRKNTENKKTCTEKEREREKKMEKLIKAKWEWAHHTSPKNSCKS